MKTRNLLAGLLLCGIVLTLSAQQAVPPPPKPVETAPANAEVMKLLRAGISERVILHVISASPAKFDTSADALAALKQAGASETVMTALLTQGTTPAEAPSSSAPTDGTPSLAETMQFLQNKLNGLGNVAYVTFFQNANDGSSWTQTFTNDITNVVADPDRCRISYHRKATNSAQLFSKTYTNTNKEFSLRDVQKIVVWPYEQSYNDWSAKNGTPNIIATSSNPHLTELSARLPRGEEAFFYFTDADLADRVAKALTHAVELCGGGNKDKEPF
jgi:hypothetical protein